ncbi:exosortase-dependent surface protein XDP1 [Neptunomonas japonica]|uniref:Ice-binding protein C-terminal domain-containing protein n=1 Tax=Neptunomonas japonica JAMM 1380 TaxID=1441457 RepID=A0A7R6SVW0_9GAMM|nr:exosortase-dependent surface protein XDP1 [Neptunomonas japonica]BBB30014.1 hypothetical protein NEJAP_2065 [Neptunomonas japonica JAMM 1380]
MNLTKLMIGLCAALAISSLNANASVSWNFKTTNSGDYRVSSTTSGSYEFVSGGSGAVTTLSAWSAPVSGSSQITNVNSLLAHNQYGLVIDQDGYGADGSGYGNSGGDSHAIDNGGKYEFVMFDFGDKDFSLDAFDIGWYSGDSDVTVMAYQGGTPGSQPAEHINGVNLSGLAANGWSVISHHSNPGTGSESVNSNLEPVYSSYWIIGAYMSAVGAGSGDMITDSNWDGIKLAGITGTISSPPPTNSVPEPSTLLMMALGLAVVSRKTILDKIKKI